MMGIDEATSSWRAERLRGGVLMIADAAHGDTAEAAVRAAGVRSLGQIDWAAAHARLERQSMVSVILAEASGVDDMRLADVLPQLDLLARGGGTGIVIALDPAQIDLIAGTLAGPNVELLCTPTLAERVAALCLAGANEGHTLHDIGRETEAARLRRLHEEVARIAETLARLTRDDPDSRDDARARSVGEPGMTYRGPADAGATVPIAPREIREAIRARRLRDQYFGQGLFEDPAWDMLLDLFAAELERAQVSVSSLCIAAAVAPTTALRWIARMTEAGLFERQPDPFDRRRAFMGLSERASAGMRQYVAAVRRVGGTIA